MKKSLAASLPFALAAVFSSAQTSSETPVPETQSESVPENAPAENAASEQALIDAAINSLPTIYETRTRVFSVCAEAPEQMRRVAHIARKLEGHFSAILNWNLVAEGAKISVWVEKNAATKDLFEVSPDFRRNAACTFFADPKTLDDYTLAFALAQTLLWQYGKEFSLGFKNNRPPLWAVSALATETAIAQNTGRFLLLRERSENARPLPTETLFSSLPASRTKQVPDETFQINAFWFYRFLRRQKLPAWQNFPNYFRGILKAPEEAFPRPKEKADSSLDLAWATAFFATIERSPAGTESLRKAQKRFEEALSFLVEIENQEKRLQANELAAHYELLGVKKLAYARLRELNEALAQTNPVWHNAFVELGIFLEMIAIVEDRSGELREGSSIWAPERGTHKKMKLENFQKQWTQVERSRDDALKLQAEILALLDSPNTSQ